MAAITPLAAVGAPGPADAVTVNACRFVHTYQDGEPVGVVEGGPFLGSLPATRATCIFRQQTADGPEFARVSIEYPGAAAVVASQPVSIVGLESGDRVYVCGESSSAAGTVDHGCNFVLQHP